MNQFIKNGSLEFLGFLSNLRLLDLRVEKWLKISVLWKLKIVTRFRHDLGGVTWFWWRVKILLLEWMVSSGVKIVTRFVAGITQFVDKIFVPWVVCYNRNTVLQSW